MKTEKGIDLFKYSTMRTHSIVYSHFQRWYKKHVSGISIVPVSDPYIQTESVLALSPSLPPTGDLRTRVDFPRWLLPKEIVKT